MEYSTFNKMNGAKTKEDDNKSIMSYYTKNFQSKKNKKFIQDKTSEIAMANNSMLTRDVITRPKYRQALPTLPHATTPGRNMQPPVITPEDTRVSKSCINTDTGDFYNRSFYILEENPNKYEKFPREGRDTRNDYRTDYN